MAIAVDVFRIVKIDELMANRLTEDQQDRQQEEAANNDFLAVEMDFAMQQRGTNARDHSALRRIAPIEDVMVGEHPNVTRKAAYSTKRVGRTLNPKRSAHTTRKTGTIRVAAGC